MKLSTLTLRWKIAFVGLVVVLVSIPVTAVGYRLSDANLAVGGSMTPVTVDDEQTVNGISLRLETVLATGRGVTVQA